MNSLHIAYAQVLCLKYNVDINKLQSLAEAYVVMYQEVLENNSKVPDTLVRSYTSEEATDVELQVLSHLLKVIYNLPVSLTKHYGSIVFETSVVAPPLEVN